MVFPFHLLFNSYPNQLPFDYILQDSNHIYFWQFRHPSVHLAFLCHISCLSLCSIIYVVYLSLCLHVGGGNLGVFYNLTKPHVYPRFFMYLGVYYIITCTELLTYNATPLTMGLVGRYGR